jgi:hypothetical protein
MYVPELRLGCTSRKWKKTGSQLCANNNAKGMEKTSNLIISFSVSSLVLVEL